MADNYEKFMEDSRKRFLAYDQEEMIRRFALRADASSIYFHILGREAALDRETGYLRRGGRRAGVNESVTVYDILSRAQNAPKLSGRWTSITDLGGHIAVSHTQNLRPDREIRPLVGRTAELDALCRRLGGVRRSQGDVSYELPLFDFFPIWMQFWDADEEFPAQLKCMWDANTLDFMHYETTWYAQHFLREELVRGVEGML